MHVNLGIGSYTLAWAIGVRGYPSPAHPLDAFGLVAEAARLRMDCVQICDNLPLQDWSADELARLRGQADAAGLSVEVGTRGTEPDLLAKYLSVAGALGSRVLRTLVSVDPAGHPRIAEAERAIQGLLPDLERRGLTLVLENYEHMRAAELRALVDRVGSGAVRVCLDPVNNFGIGEDQQRVLETLGPVMGALHLKDFRISRADDRLGFVLRGAPAGEGLLDVAGALARLAASAAGRPRSLSAVIELWTPWQGSIEASVALERAWAEQSVANMRRVLPPDGP